MKPKIAMMVMAFLEIVVRMELPAFVKVQTAEAVDTENLHHRENNRHSSETENTWKKNVVTTKEETFILECKKHGDSMNCKPTKKVTKKVLSPKKRQHEKLPTNPSYTHAASNRRKKKREKLKTDAQIARLEAKLKKHDNEVATLLHKAIHEAREHIPTFNEMLKLVNEIIDEEYQKHTKIILEEEEIKPKDDNIGKDGKKLKADIKRKTSRTMKTERTKTIVKGNQQINIKISMNRKKNETRTEKKSKHTNKNKNKKSIHDKHKTSHNVKTKKVLNNKTPHNNLKTKKVLNNKTSTVTKPLEKKKSSKNLKHDKLKNVTSKINDKSINNKKNEDRTDLKEAVVPESLSYTPGLKLPLDKMRKQLASKKMKYTSHNLTQKIQSSFKVTEVKASMIKYIDKNETVINEETRPTSTNETELLEKTPSSSKNETALREQTRPSIKNETALREQTRPSNEESNVDLNYIIGRLASKRKEFLDRVLCSVNTPYKDDRTFDDVVNVPWIGLPGNNKIVAKEKYSSTTGHGKLFGHHTKTPLLKIIPSKVKYDFTEAASSGEEFYEDEDETSGDEYDVTPIKDLLLSHSKLKVMTLHSVSPILFMKSSVHSESYVKNPYIETDSDPNIVIQTTELPHALIDTNSMDASSKVHIVSIVPTPAYISYVNSVKGHMTISVASDDFDNFATFDEIFPSDINKPKHDESIIDTTSLLNTNDINVKPQLASFGASYASSSIFRQNSMLHKLLVTASPSNVLASSTIDFSSSSTNNMTPIMDQILAEAIDRNQFAGVSASPSYARVRNKPSSMMYSDPINPIPSTKYHSQSIEYADLGSNRLLGKNFLVRLKLMIVYNETLLYQRNEEYKRLKKQVEESICKLYKHDESYHSNKVVSITRIPVDNMTLVDIELYFKDRSINHLSRLEDELKTEQKIADKAVENKIMETSLLNDRITDIKWCLPPCYNPYHCFPICDETCCASPPNAFESTNPSTFQVHDVARPLQQQLPVNNNPTPYIVYNYILTTPEELTKHTKELFQSKPHEINAFTSQVDAETGNVLCGPYCSPYYCLPSCMRNCCLQKK